MITQRVRKANDGLPKSLLFNDVNLFHAMRLNNVTAYPSWITETLTGFTPYIAFITLSDLPITEGEYTFYFTQIGAPGSPPESSACLIIEIVESLTDELDICTDSNSKNIVWINREGGRSNYIFNERQDTSIDTGKPVTYENDSKLKYTYKGKGYKEITLYKTGMSRTEIDLFESLRLSIQAWEYNETTSVFTEIIFDPKSFDKYNTHEEFYEVSMTYRYSKHINVQVQ